MAKSAVVTARLDAEISAELDRLAEHQDRSRSWLVAQAIERYVRAEGELLTFIKEGQDSLSRGDYVTHEQLVAEIEARKRRKSAA